MKIFNKGEGWESKVNFVDEHNVVLGYDMNQHCCERADWSIEDEPRTSFDYDMPLKQALENEHEWRFDASYFAEIADGAFDAGGMAIFKIINTLTGAAKYIHIFNSHNGYYSHGFAFLSLDGKMIKEGIL